MTEVTGELVELRGPLTPEQEQRVVALKEARRALQTSGMIGGALPPNRGPGDLTWLAEWILDGPDDPEPERDPVAYGEGYQVGYVNGMTVAAIIARNISQEAGAAILNRLNEPKRQEPADDTQRSFDDESSQSG